MSRLALPALTTTLLLAGVSLACASPNGNSTGAESEPTAPGGAAGAAGAADTTAVPADAGDPADEPAEPSSAWATYRDPEGRFELRHPGAIVALPAPADLPQRNPALAGQVRFQQRRIADSELADREPAVLTVEIYEAAPESLASWLDLHGRLLPTATSMPATVAGAREALRVVDSAQRAPNDFLWIAGRRHVFALVPLSEHGPEMAASFRLGAGESDSTR